MALLAPSGRISNAEFLTSSGSDECFGHSAMPHKLFSPFQSWVVKKLPMMEEMNIGGTWKRNSLKAGTALQNKVQQHLRMAARLFKLR